jgi:protein-S-isoprenylcysteine O-methyltransferase Ste14
MLVLKNVLYTVAVPALVAVYLPLYLAHERGCGVSSGLFVVAILLLATGCGIIVKSVWDFAVWGKGTPFPIDPPTVLVTKGIYQYTRNPIYLGILTAILGWAALFQSVALLRYAIGTYVFFQGFIILYEERHLRKIFGDEYQQYCERVSRWLPKFRRAGTKRKRR